MSFKVGVANLSLAIFDMKSKCSSYFGIVISALDWRQQVYDHSNEEFLKEMYLLGCVKFISMIVCNHHISLLTTKLYLVDTSSSDFYSRILMI